MCVKGRGLSAVYPAPFDRGKAMAVQSRQGLRLDFRRFRDRQNVERDTEEAVRLREDPQCVVRFPGFRQFKGDKIVRRFF